MQHCSFILKNSCANKKIHDFFQNGEMPGSDNFCASETGPFGVTLKDLEGFLPAANSSTETGNQTSTTPVMGPAGRTEISLLSTFIALSMVTLFIVWLIWQCLLIGNSCFTRLTAVPNKQLVAPYLRSSIPVCLCNHPYYTVLYGSFCTYDTQHKSEAKVE